MTNLNYRGNLVLFLALANELITSWEAGRLAATNEGSCSDNPYLPNTRDHDEWNRGFVYGVGEGKVNSRVVIGSVETPYPVMAAGNLPERSFWAAANQVQISDGLQEEQLAARLGVTPDCLRTAMIHHRFWDDDAIPLGIRAAS